MTVKNALYDMNGMTVKNAVCHGCLNAMCRTPRSAGRRDVPDAAKPSPVPEGASRLLRTI
ncbi:hypothetical protein GXP70_05910 [Paenibacillus lycopersici]|uniref:Uncharacterized protein n=1 Tax=Paenibacillus lycopersici TaxID=2704462 RepID=A0A6C0G410_9BACL|nr:hypothetical protein [Paenibacillus lycopersici]QHT59535.1 hypothetical protein GXP70_05910 [Paenibacillus lycopersici]